MQRRIKDQQRETAINYYLDSLITKYKLHHIDREILYKLINYSAVEFDRLYMLTSDRNRYLDAVYLRHINASMRLIENMKLDISMFELMLGLAIRLHEIIDDRDRPYSIEQGLQEVIHNVGISDENLDMFIKNPNIVFAIDGELKPYYDMWYMMNDYVGKKYPLNLPKNG